MVQELNDHTESPVEWPPRSPHAVLLSTPGGRERLRRLAAHDSPSPTKRSTATPSAFRSGKDRLKADMAMEAGEEDEDDEETLQLQLQEIQARLKLKKLQKAKQSSDTEKEISRAGSAPLVRANSVAASRAQSRLAEVREERLQRSKSQASIVNVPASPVRRAKPAENPRSPGRVLLGIDKGLKGSDISLKRAPSLRKNLEAAFQEPRRAGPFLQRAASQAGSRVSEIASRQSSIQSDRPQTFSEKLAAARAQDIQREQRETRIKKKRSMAFDIDQDQMESFKKTAVELPEMPRTAPEFSREEVLGSYQQGSKLSRSKTTPDLRSAMRTTSDSSTMATNSTRTDSRSSLDKPNRQQAPSRSKTLPGEVTESEASIFEPYSSTHLSKRIIPHKVLTRTLTGKKTFIVPDLLKIVKAPDFSGPDVEEDVVVFGIIAKKSQPISHASRFQGDKRGKFMIMTLTDLKWELDLFLFDSGFEKFWKLTPGTIIAVLNPGFMPPPRGKADTGKFSLTLNSSDDTILEIGTARDLGYCKSVKRDGKTCDSWVDKRHTEFCDYHVNETLKKTHANRMEVNTMNFGRGGGRGGRKNATTHREAKQAETTRYDRGSHSRIFIAGKTPANLLDDVDYDPDAFHRGSSKEERMTRRLIAQEKERELQKKLAAMGGGLGADYARKLNHLEPDPNSSNAIEEPPDAAALGLLSGKGADVHLSPIKRKRSNNAPNTVAIGWGGELIKELGRLKNGESLQPVKKKTRFVTEKGIREAGRESFGGEVAKATFDDIDDDSDDDLDIVRE